MMAWWLIALAVVAGWLTATGLFLLWLIFPRRRRRGEVIEIERLVSRR
jgi:uncharacterized membrane protein